MAKHEFVYDDETRQITAAGYKVNEIWGVIAGELERRKLWHATRDAVLRSADLSREGLDKSLEIARWAADREHGPLDDERGG